jgi:D-threo-aldose 1-dehydrogenase
MNNRGRQIYKPQFRFGLGGVSLGNEFNKHTDKDAEATLDAAWAVGIRYFDVAPWYGFGLSERRFGHFLHNQKREDYLLSSKVGKLFKASKTNKHAEIYPLSDSPNDVVFDYTADGVRRSIEDSLQRLGVDSLDVAFVHDISPDFAFFPNGWEEQYEIARKGAFPALSKMRDEGIIRAWGIGVNTALPSSRLWKMRIRTYVCAPASTHWSITPPQYTSFSPLCGGRTSRSSLAPR